MTSAGQRSRCLKPNQNNDLDFHFVYDELFFFFLQNSAQTIMKCFALVIAKSECTSALKSAPSFGACVAGMQPIKGSKDNKVRMIRGRDRPGAIFFIVYRLRWFPGWTHRRLEE